MRRIEPASRTGQVALEYLLAVTLAVGLLWGTNCAFHELNYGSTRTASLPSAAGISQAATSHPANADSGQADERPGQFSSSAESKLSPIELWAAPLSIALLGMISICYSHHRLRKPTRRDRRGEFGAGQATEIVSDRLFDKRQEILKVINSDVTALLEGRLKVRHLMTMHPVTVTEQTRLVEVETLMAQNQMRHMLVCNAEGTLTGVVSDRDLTGAQGKVAADVMTRDTFTIDADVQVSPAATLMIDRRISMLPVTDQGKLCGVITTTDLVMALQSGLQVLLKRSVDGGTRTTDRK
jgi:acetoin utilization protein AcuB